MNIQHIITTSLIDYDTNYPIIRYLVNNTALIGKTTDSDMKRTVFNFINPKTNKVILETEVEVLAIYYDKYSIWSWAWSQPELINSETSFSKEIVRYALKLGSDMSYLKSILTTSRGVINDLTQLDINLAIASNIIKQPYIYPFTSKLEGDRYHLTYYFILLNQDGIRELSEKLGFQNATHLPREN